MLREDMGNTVAYFRRANQPRDVRGDLQRAAACSSNFEYVLECQIYPSRRTVRKVTE